MLKTCLIFMLISFVLVNEAGNDGRRPTLTVDQFLTINLGIGDMVVRL